MLFINKRVKTIATIGPASESRELMLRLAKKGANIYRLNFSHGIPEEHQQRLEFARSITQEAQRPLSVLLDTKGPEIRTHNFVNDEATITKNSFLIIHTTEEILGDNQKFSINYPNLINDLEVDQKLLVDDGKLQLIVVEINRDEKTIVCKAINEHVIKNRRAIMVPGIKLSLPFISEKDKTDIIFGIKQLEVDYIAASFVSDVEDIKSLRTLLAQHNAEHIQIIAKIETKYALNNIDEIIASSDGIMIARGDLALDIPYVDVPLWQKRIIRKCNKTMKPVIVATQMLESMVNNPLPTRAEVSDIYWAVDLGVDTTMLSGETANGEYPEKVIETMSRVIRKAEIHFWYEGYLEKFARWSTSPHKTLAYDIGKQVLTEKIHQVIVLDSSADQMLIKTLSNAKLRASVIYLVNNERTRRAFGIWYGIYPELVANPAKTIDDNNLLMNMAKKYGAKQNDQILIVNNDQIRSLTIQ